MRKVVYYGCGSCVWCDYTGNIDGTLCNPNNGDCSCWKEDELWSDGHKFSEEKPGSNLVKEIRENGFTRIMRERVVIYAEVGCSRTGKWTYVESAELGDFTRGYETKELAGEIVVSFGDESPISTEFFNLVCPAYLRDQCLNCSDQELCYKVEAYKSSKKFPTTVLEVNYLDEVVSEVEFSRAQAELGVNDLLAVLHRKKISQLAAQMFGYILPWTEIIDVDKLRKEILG